VTDPSPRAGFTVGSLAEVERSLLPLLPRTSYPDSRVSPTFSRVRPFPMSPLRLRLLTAPSTFYSITGNLSLFSRCPYPYLSFVLLSIVLRFFFSIAEGQWPRRGYLREPLRRRKQFFASKTTLNSSLCAYLARYYFMDVYRKNNVVKE